MRTSAVKAPSGCNCHCNKCDSGHHCGNRPNCNVKT
jgi:hypothetical protein